MTLYAFGAFGRKPVVRDGKKADAKLEGTPSAAEMCNPCGKKITAPPPP